MFVEIVLTLNNVLVIAHMTMINFFYIFFKFSAKSRKLVLDLCDGSFISNISISLRIFCSVSMIATSLRCSHVHTLPLFLVFFIDLRSPTEKKMLQSMLRKASAIGKTLEVSKSPNNKKNASISTEDLGE